MGREIKEVVLTGGPCAGKTTALSYLSRKLGDWGWRVFIVPEVATMFIGGGIPDIGSIVQNETQRYYQIEKQMLRTQLALRKEFLNLAAIFEGEKRVLIHDRGPMDVKAYLPEAYFEAILQECRLSLEDVRDSYDGVIHLVTAANGAERFYTIENNKARRETPEEARALDEKTSRAWWGHSHLKIIDNSTDFERKIGRVLQAAARVLGIPVPIEIERKFLLKGEPDFRHEALRQAQRVAIEQIYLAAAGEERIRRRSQNGSSTYYKTRKVRISPRIREETESIITAAEYLHLQALRDPGTNVIRKHRYCFVHNHQYFELDVFAEPEPRLCLLEVELTEENDAVDLPPFLNVEREVTGDPAYTNRAIAAIK